MLQTISTIFVILNYVVEAKYVATGSPSRRKWRWACITVFAISFKRMWRQAESWRKWRKHTSMICKICYGYFPHNQWSSSWHSVKLSDRWLGEETCYCYNVRHPARASQLDCRKYDFWRGTGFVESWPGEKRRADRVRLLCSAINLRPGNFFDSWISA